MNSGCKFYEPFKISKEAGFIFAPQFSDDLRPDRAKKRKLYYLDIFQRGYTYVFYELNTCVGCMNFIYPCQSGSLLS